MSRTNKLIILVFVNLLIVVFLAWGVKTNLWNNFDLQVTHGVQSFHPLVWDTAMKSVSWIGYPPQTFWITIIILGMMMAFLGWKAGIITQVMSTGAYLSGNLFKFLVDRSRPENYGIIPWQKGLEGGTRSFPAGHVEIFTALGLVAAVFVSRKYPSRAGKVAIGFIFLYLVLLGISRIYLGEHWFTDVLAGYLIGISWWGIFMLLFPHHDPKNS